MVINIKSKSVRLCNINHIFNGDTAGIIQTALEDVIDETDLEGTNPGITCKYQHCKTSEVGGPSLCFGNICVKSAVDLSIIVYQYCSVRCLWEHNKNLAKTTFTNEISKLKKNKNLPIDYTTFLMSKLSLCKDVCGFEVFQVHKIHEILLGNGLLSLNLDKSEKMEIRLLVSQVQI